IVLSTTNARRREHRFFYYFILQFVVKTSNYLFFRTKNLLQRCGTVVLVSTASRSQSLSRDFFPEKGMLLTIHGKREEFSFREELEGVSFREELEGVSFREELEGDSFREELDGESFRQELEGESFREELEAIYKSANYSDPEIDEKKEETYVLWTQDMMVVNVGDGNLWNPGERDTRPLMMTYIQRCYIIVFHEFNKNTTLQHPNKTKEWFLRRAYDRNKER
ncbi:hypothetical protein C0J52_27438, partial [Blattella germanica]